MSFATTSPATPIPIDAAAASLSAILLNNAYYEFILAGRKEVDGLPWVGEDRLRWLTAGSAEGHAQACRQCVEVLVYLTGNFFFMTLGNLQLNPRAGVLFIDFNTGDLLTLTGTAEVVSEGEELKAFDGAERAWRFRVEAGQNLPIRRTAAGGEVLHRTYTISQAPADAGLRLRVKHEGAASSHLHEDIRVGDTIEALGPRGQFTIDEKLHRPAVLIGAGVGITPMVAFARHLVTEGFRNRRMRPLHLIQVAHSEAMRAFGVESTTSFSCAGRAASCRRRMTVCATWGCATRASRPRPSVLRR